MTARSRICLLLKATAPPNLDIFDSSIRLVIRIDKLVCRFGLASVLHVVVDSLEELFVEKCYDLITTAALRAMGGCRKLKV